MGAVTVRALAYTHLHAPAYTCTRFFTPPQELSQALKNARKGLPADWEGAIKVAAAAGAAHSKAEVRGPGMRFTM